MKYRNTKIEVGGIKYDSKAELARHLKLKEMERDGLIRCLETQVKYTLLPAVQYEGERKKAAMKYIADFTYWQGDKHVIEDVKGMPTPVFNVKRHMMKALHGLEVKIVKVKAK